MIRIEEERVMKKIIALSLVLIMALVGFTSCGSNSDKEVKDGELSGSLTIAGSTSVQPLSEILADNYMEDNPGVKVQVQGGGSGQGIKSIVEKVADIGALSRDVKDEEKESISNQYKIALDGVAIIVNKEVGIDNLTIDQIKDIYTGKVTNWKDVGGQDAEIKVVSREEGSGTRGAFVEITGVDDGEKDNTTASAIVQPSTGAAKTTVKSTPNSIAYVSLEAVDDTVKEVKVEGVKPSTDSIKDGSYKISRPFMYVVGDDVSAETQSYIDYIMSDKGQEAIEKAGFIPAA